MGPEKGLAPDEVAALRRERLVQVDRALGLDALLIGEFRDGGMAHTPLQEMVDAVGACLDALRPQVVIAHDPRGVNAHPDHIATHWSVRAALATRPGIRLAMLAYLSDVVEQIKPRLMFATPEEAVDCVVELVGDEIDAKEQCLVIHEALITLRDAPDNNRILRPPIERYDFLA